MRQFFLTIEGQPERRVSEDEYVRAERRAGFHPAHIDVRDPRYHTAVATAGFCSSRAGISGRTTA